MNKIYEQAGLLQEELVAIRRELHRNVEVGTKLPNTKALVRRKLTEYGYAPEDIAESSVTVICRAELCCSEPTWTDWLFVKKRRCRFSR